MAMEQSDLGFNQLRHITVENGRTISLMARGNCSSSMLNHTMAGLRAGIITGLVFVLLTVMIDMRADGKMVYVLGSGCRWLPVVLCCTKEDGIKTNRRDMGHCITPRAGVWSISAGC